MKALTSKFSGMFGLGAIALAIFVSISASGAESPDAVQPAGSLPRHSTPLPQRRTGTPQATSPRALPPFGGTWQAVATAPVGGLSSPLLLTDGTVIAQDGNTRYWYKLTPDITGSYVNGTWSAIASLPVISGTQYAPQYHASAVLPDGRVIIMGGEYNGSGTEVWTNLGAIYDPVANTWTPVAAPTGTGWTQIGDAASVVLADGTFMLSACCADPTADALLNASTLTWTATGVPNAGFNYQDEQGYELLPNGNVLTIDIWTNYSIAGNATNAEQYVPASSAWMSAGNTPTPLADPYVCGNFEIGPAVLRPDGTLVAFGGNTGCTTPTADPTAIYNSTGGTWSAGPNVPLICGTGTTACDLADAPGVLLPNGNILFAASSGYGQSPTHFFEFTSANAINQVADTLYNASSAGAYYYNFLVLPNGQILSTDFSSVAEVYNPVGGPSPSWAPVISTVSSTVAPGGTYSISGTQFNGLSQGAYYGDDAQMATNYPIVRITNSATGHVFYARTFNHSTMSVAPGTVGSTNFTAPPSAEIGASTLVVVANGIPSAPAAVCVGSASQCAPTFTLTPSSLPFGNQFVFEKSAAMTATITNTGPVALPITSITITGPNRNQFSKTTTCKASLAIGASCTINAVFEPTSIGSKTATLNVNDGGGSGTKTVALSGTGVAAPYTLSPRSLAFGSVTVGTVSAVQTVTMTNTTTAAVPITSITITGVNHTQFKKGTACGLSLAVGASCTIKVNFAPTTTGAMTATLNVNGGGGDGTQTVALSGTGI